MVAVKKISNDIYLKLHVNNMLASQNAPSKEKEEAAIKRSIKKSRATKMG